MKDKSNLYPNILRQAESLAKEFSYCIHSVYLIGSSVIDPELANDIDIVVFYEGDDQLGRLLWRNFLSLNSKMDCTCVKVSQSLSELNIEHPLLRLYMSLSEHGKLLYGKKMNFDKLSLERVWAFRWWCLFLEVLNSDLKVTSPILQAQALVVSEVIGTNLAYSKHSMLQAYSQLATKTPFSRMEILKILDAGIERFKSQQSVDVQVSEVISMPWAAGLKNYFQWVTSTQSDHLKSHTIRDILLSFDNLGLYIEKIPETL